MLKHFINKTQTVKEALQKLNGLGEELTLFVLDDNECLVGTLTDGDIRRGLVNDLEVSDLVENVMFRNFSYLTHNEFTIHDIINIKKKKINLLPIVDRDFRVKRIINFDDKKSVLPVDALIMAGGEGQRLRPLTENLPKPLLNVGNKPIIKYNVDLLSNYGIYNIHISVKYLGEKIIQYFSDENLQDLNISYIKEDIPLGTIGALALVDELFHDYVLIMNSDLLTNVDLEDFFIAFVNENCDMAVATIPYKVNVPYAVFETNNNLVENFIEKPTYTYFSNAGIYLIKKEIINIIPQSVFFNATDLMEELLRQGRKVLSYPLLNYWLDIGRHDEYQKAQEDVKHIKF